MEQDGLLFKKEVFDIIGAAIEVHRVLGSGFLESVYDEALQVEMEARHIPFKSQVLLPVTYKGQLLSKEFFADMVAYDKIIVELKAINQLTNIEEAQLLNYLKVTGLRVGLLVNFGSHARLEWKRLIF